MLRQGVAQVLGMTCERQHPVLMDISTPSLGLCLQVSFVLFEGGFAGEISASKHICNIDEKAQTAVAK